MGQKQKSQRNSFGSGEPNDIQQVCLLCFQGDLNSAYIDGYIKAHNVDPNEIPNWDSMGLQYPPLPPIAFCLMRLAKVRVDNEPEIRRVVECCKMLIKHGADIDRV